MFLWLAKLQTDHWQDVLVGSALGLVMSYFCYRQYFPKLTSRLSHRPYAPRHTLDNPLQEIEHEDETRRHLRSRSDASPDNHNPHRETADGRGSEPYRDGSDGSDDELHGMVPRTGAQDLTETWQDGRGKISDVEAGRA
jgi:diacylglycerol diphosphate phosphatase / phosphatidate phosphatase